ncbi:beta-propeller domain-containing protein [Herbidospora cretacea]|uniref:beta-propeller domain-containing protein n=1 Tax=Herbidospora cretacea TaxID=28444 RepID=UPI0007741B40|nr:beta-propeller domain-containing protein [Herbidospora cretacea]
MTTSIRVAGAIAIALLAAACTPGAGPSPDPVTPINLTTNIKLVAFDDCDSMLEGLREAAVKHAQAFQVLPMARAEAADSAARDVAKSTAASGNQTHSSTNVHEAGVDEPDLVKTDGDRVITINRGVLRVIDAESRRVTGTLKLLGDDLGWTEANLLVSGDRALVLFNQGGYASATARAKPGFEIPTTPRYVLVDLAGTPKVIGSLAPLNAQHVDARMVGTTVRIVVRGEPQVPLPEYNPNMTQQQMLDAVKETYRRAPLDAWLPKYEIESGGQTTPGAVKCENVSHPADFTGRSLLTVHTLDLNGSFGTTDAISVAADGDTVYGTGTSLYVTSNPLWWGGFFPMPIAVDVDPVPVPDVPSDAATPVAPSPDPDMPTQIPDPGKVAPDVQASPTDVEKVVPTAETVSTPTPSSAPPTAEVITPSPSESGDVVPEVVQPERTEIHRFDVSGGGVPRYLASGSVPGRLLNQYSLSEYEDHLRVATTTNTTKTSESGVYVLKADTLAAAGQVTGLGKGERIYSVRFIGPVGYMVTFRQVDPLYTLDLRDPQVPKVTGELKITGFSAYLHPAGDGRLIGVGQEANTKGQTQGTQVSLFDVRDPGAPAVLSRYHQEDSATQAEWDPHAFLYWAQDGLALIPLATWGADYYDGSQALVLKIGDTIEKAGVITHPKADPNVPLDPSIRRSVIIGDTVWTFSDLGVKVSDKASLADRTWIKF